jgi:hypothetical protein
MSARWAAFPTPTRLQPSPHRKSSGRRFAAATAPISAIFQSNFGRELFYDAADSILDTEDLISSELDVVEPGGRGTMKRMLGAAMLLGMAAIMPTQQASAQDPIGGAIVGGALGGIIGGAVGRGAGGAVAGAVIGATTGAVIAAEAQRRNSGYYWWRGGCYYRYPNGSWLQVQPGYC